MLTEFYIEALLVDEDLADQVWYMWNAGVIDDELAAIAWFLLREIIGDVETVCLGDNKAKPVQRRAAKGPRFVRDVRRHEGPKIAGPKSVTERFF